jgi:hypothetical protein
MVLRMALPGAAMTRALSAGDDGSARKLLKAVALPEEGSMAVTAITLGQAAGR